MFASPKNSDHFISSSLKSIYDDTEVWTAILQISNVQKELFDLISYQKEKIELLEGLCKRQ